MTRFLCEGNRKERMSSAMRRFSKVVDELNLRDLPLQGGPFTWSDDLNGRSMSRLDSFLVTED